MRMQTPAQAYGHPTINDVPVQGPTDPGIRDAECRFVQTNIPTHPACVDCDKGQSPMHGLGEKISFGGNVTRGFALAAPGDPDVWTTLAPDQQTWVSGTLIHLNDLIVKATGTSCPTWNPSNITSVAGCFQGWFNRQQFGLTKPDGSKVVLRTDGVFDQDTLDALRTVAALRPTDFATPFPGTTLPAHVDATADTKKLSTGAMVGIATAGVTVLGGLAYAATRLGGKKKRGGGRKRR